MFPHVATATAIQDMLIATAVEQEPEQAAKSAPTMPVPQANTTTIQELAVAVWAYALAAQDTSTAQRQAAILTANMR